MSQTTAETEMTEQYIKGVIGAMINNPSEWNGNRFTKETAEEIGENATEEISLNFDPMENADVSVFVRMNEEREINVENVKTLDLFRFTLTEFFGLKKNDEGLVLKFTGTRGGANITFNDNGLTESDGMKYSFNVLFPQ